MAVATKQINGDVSVGRNVTSGGNARIRGSATIDHDLVVNGWLDAKNVRGINKGLFGSLDALEKTYPQPQTGWCALIGDTLPAALYVAHEGKWTSTGKTAGEMVLDLRTYQSAVAELQDTVRIHDDDIDEMSGALYGDGSGTDGALYELNQIAKLVGYKPGVILSGWKNLIAAAENYFALCQTLDGSSPDSSDYGRPGTFVTLMADGRINPDFIPDTVRGVAVFDGFETAPAGSIQSGSDSLPMNGHIIYDSAEPIFYLKRTVDGVTTYYRNWKGSDAYADENGFPRADRLYVLDGDGNRGELYAFDPGSDAFYRAGFTAKELARLLDTERNVGYLQSRVARHEERMADLEDEDTYIWKVIQGVRRGGWNTVEEALLAALESSDDIAVTKPADTENLFCGDAMRLSLTSGAVNRIRDAIAGTPTADFIADWLDAGKTWGVYDQRQYTDYDEDTGSLLLYDEPVTYAEAREAMRLKAVTDHEMLWEKGLMFSTAKHILPLRVTNHKGNAGRRCDFQFATMDVIAFDAMPYASVPADGSGLKFRCDVRKILNLKVEASTKFTADCFVCPNLEYLELIGLTQSLNLRHCSKLTLESLELIVAKAANAEQITLTLHADAYARLTDELIATAQAKQITLTTA